MDFSLEDKAYTFCLSLSLVSGYENMSTRLSFTILSSVYDKLIVNKMSAKS